MSGKSQPKTSKPWFEDTDTDMKSFYACVIDWDNKEASVSEADSAAAELPNIQEEHPSAENMCADLQHQQENMQDVTDVLEEQDTTEEAWNAPSEEAELQHTREKALQEEIELLKKQLATEVELRQKAEDARCMDLVLLRLQAVSQTHSSVSEKMAELQQQNKAMRDEIVRLNELVKSTAAEAKQKEEARQKELYELRESERMKFKRRAKVFLRENKEERHFLCKKLNLLKGEKDSFVKELAEVKNQLTAKDEEMKAFEVEVSQQRETFAKQMESSRHKLAEWGQQETSHLSRLRELKVEKQKMEEQMREVQESVQTAAKKKVSFHRATVELRKQKAAIIKDVQEHLLALGQKAEEMALFKQVVRGLEELEKKQRKWYRKLLCH